MQGEWRRLDDGTEILEPGRQTTVAQALPVFFGLTCRPTSLQERMRLDTEFDRFYQSEDFTPMLRLRFELARVWWGRGRVPTDDQLSDALNALPSYKLPPPSEIEPDEDDDAVPLEPSLVERLAYFLDLGEGAVTTTISARRAAIIRAAMEAAEEGGRRSAPPPIERKSGIDQLRELLRVTRKTGQAKPLYNANGALAAVSDGDFADFIGAVKKAVADSTAGLHIDINLLKRKRRQAKEQARVYATAEQTLGTCVRTGRPAIVVSNKQLADLRAEAVARLREANEPPVVFERRRELVRSRLDALGAPYLEPFTEMSLRGRLSDVANFFLESNSGNTATFPPRALCEEILSYPHPAGTFPVVEAITRSPVVRADGTIFATPGFDPITHMIYVPPPGFELPGIPENPSVGEIEAAKAVLLDVVQDFPFESAADRTNFFAFKMTPLIRQLVDVAPMAVIDSPAAGSGKGLLTDVAAVVATGEVAAVIPPPANRDEWPKLLSSLLDNGRTFIVFDNLHDALRSDALEAVLTKPFLQFRQLGHTRERIVPNRAVWAVTGNNVAVSRDMVRRCFRIRIDPRCAQPHLRKNFKHPNLVQYCKAERPALLAALLVLIRAWYAAGKPAFGGTALGTYTAWKEMVSGILKNAGFEDFLGNQRTLYSEMDVESEEWESFLAQIHERFVAVEFSVADIVSMIHGGTITTLPREVARIYGQSTSHKETKPNPFFAVQLGHILRAHRGTRYGEQEMYLERGTEDRHRKVVRYRIRMGR